ncbi:MAG: non-ribosomal peptide synthetase, partial [bacterium]|nr:non-ribosomal peptide synthetase [bacterium]
GIWEEVLGRPFIDVRAHFFHLGGHSLLAVQLMARIRREFAKDLPLATLFQVPTLEHLAAVLRDQGAALRREVLVKIQPQGSERPLFFVHPIGGNVLCYARLARHLGSGQPVYGLQTPELGQHQARLREIAGMAELYLEAVRAVEPAGPYRLGGWSMGGVVAFEMARQLAAEGEEIELLALIDSFVPHSDEADDEALVLAYFARDLQGLLARPVALP